jgi:putative spermidine/putrescine transport system substrate-binding protein
MSAHEAIQNSAAAPTRRRLLGVALAGGLLASPALRPAQAQEKVLYVNTWGGVWERAARRHVFDPFTKDTGIEIRTISPVSFAKLAGQMRSGAYEFDVTTLGAGEMVRANEAKIIESVEDSRIDLSRLWPNAVFQNGIGFDGFATLIASRKGRYPQGGPKNWAEFWDVEKFPGSRSLQRYPARILPIALLADGVPIDKLYPLDIDRAFRSLDRLKPHIRVWWTQGQQSQQLLRDGEIDLIGIWQGRVFELIDQGHPIDMTWNQAQIDKGFWVVAKGTPRREIAWQFIESASRPERQAAFCQEAVSSPLNPEAFKFIPAEVARRMPTSPENYPLTFEQDILNFGGNIQTVSQRFDRWLGA